MKHVIVKCFIDKVMDPNTCRMNENYKFTKIDKASIFNCILHNTETMGSIFITYLPQIHNAQDIFKTHLVNANCIQKF